jgi:hypothetical protein
MTKLKNETQCKLCNHNFSNKYNLIRHLEENNCKKINEMNLYEIYKKFSNIKTTNDVEIQTEINKNSIGIQTETNVELDSSNDKLYLASDLKYNYLSFEELKLYIEDYKYDTNILYLSKIIKSLICHEEHVSNHIIKYTTVSPPKFVFINENINNQIEICNLKLTVNYFLKHMVKYVKNIMIKFRKYAKTDDDWYDLYNDNLENLFMDLNKESNIESALKNVLQNYLLRNPVFKYTQRSAFKIN